jgi:hypothetical protein
VSIHASRKEERGYFKQRRVLGTFIKPGQNNINISSNTKLKPFENAYS